jgi:hypothetical protein
MIYCYFFGPTGFRRPLSSFWNFAEGHVGGGVAADDPDHPLGRHHDRMVRAARVRPVRSGDSLHALAALPVLRRNSAR